MTINNKDQYIKNTRDVGRGVNERAVDAAGYAKLKHSAGKVKSRDTGDFAKDGLAEAEASQQASFGRSQGVRGQDQRLAGLIRQRAEGGGPSVAASVAQGRSDEAMRAAMAAQAGGGVLGTRQALATNQAGQIAAAREGGNLSFQEQNAARQQLAGLLHQRRTRDMQEQGIYQGQAADVLTSRDDVARRDASFRNQAMVDQMGLDMSSQDRALQAYFTLSGNRDRELMAQQRKDKQLQNIAGSGLQAIGEIGANLAGD